MKNFKQVMGALSRDMLFLHGHVVSVRGLDGAAQRSAYQPTHKPSSAPTPQRPATSCKPRLA